jgi:hypothetical protein
VVDAALETGLQVELHLMLVFDEDTFSESLSLPARVVWCTGIGGMHQLGTAFIGLSQDQVRYLELFIRYLEEGAAAAQSSQSDDTYNGDPFAS